MLLFQNINEEHIESKSRTAKYVGNGRDSFPRSMSASVLTELTA